MQATVTDDLDLVLRWHDGGETIVRFSLASSSEFTVTCKLFWQRGLHYQGSTTVTFDTMCYGYDLEQFRLELSKMAKGEADSARFLNSGEDFEIRIEPRERMGCHVLCSELRYRHFRLVGDVACDSELVLPVGPAEDLSRAAEAIRELLRLLQVDCRSLYEMGKST
ncbi:MAG: hypothetical protein ABMA26_00350 [Limisphaerales bacterium]